MEIYVMFNILKVKQPLTVYPLLLFFIGYSSFAGSYLRKFGGRRSEENIKLELKKNYENKNIMKGFLKSTLSSTCPRAEYEGVWKCWMF